MADFQPFVPHGKIKLYRFVPLDESYQNTLHFPDRAAQLAYFGCNNQSPSGYSQADCKVSFSGQSFTRNERQYVRIEGNACNYYDCNYMAFQNEAYGEMWFFAFIHTVEYINSYCTEISFELDVMQSFMWNYELRECYVVREHSLTDLVGDSLTPENVPDFPMRYAENKRSGWFNKNYFVLVTSFDMAHVSDWRRYPTYSINDGMPTGAQLTFIDSDDVQTIVDTMQLIANNGAMDGVVTAFLFPKALCGSALTFGLDSSYSIENGDDLNGYSPANNKLFTYPFTSIIVDTGNVQQVYKQELFKKVSNNLFAVTFTVQGVLSAIPQVIVKPLDYDIPEDEIFPYTDSSKIIVMENFPIVHLTGDNYANWWGQNGFAIAGSMAVDVAKIVGGISLTGASEGLDRGKGVKWAVEGAGDIMGQTANVLTNMHTPPTSLQSSNGYGLYATGNRDIYVRVLMPTGEGARIVDDYFTMWGYNCSKIKVPNIRNYNTCRPHFNYIKCREMSFHWELFTSEGKGTSVPQRYMNKIMSIYQNGVTFWKNPEEVGRYETLKYANRPS